MHHLLTRQLKRIGLLSDTIPSSLEAWQKFLERVSQSYVESDQGYELLERSLALSSQEMQALNEQLRRTSETQLADERDKLHTVIRSVGDGLCVVDQNWKIQLLNPEGQRLWAVREEEVVGRSLDHIITLTSQQDGREHNVMDAIFQETTAGRAVRSDDGQLTTTTGRSFPVSYVLAPIVRDSRSAGAVLVFRDTTDRKRAEEALRTSEERLAVTVQGAAVGIWDWDLKTNQMYFSPQWKQQLGYLDAELRNEAEEWKSRIHIEDQPEVLAVVTDCWDGRRDQFEIEHRVRYRDGSYRWILSRGSVIRDAFGVTARMVGIHIDTTDRKRIEEDLRTAKEAAEAASKAKSEFLANMSHEIRTPMNGVLGTTELLLNTELTDKQRRLASTVHRSGKTLLAIVNDILDFSKIEAGKLELETVDFDLSQLLNEALELFSESARRKHLGLTQHIAAAVPLYLKGDPVRLRQIILNLLSNAIKFTEIGGISVTTDVLSDSGTDMVLRLAVIDSGIGIPLSAQTRIFDAFAQADGSTTRRYGGTGLGLSIVKQLIALMGGAIALESTPGVGSTFTFTIRLHRQDPSAALIKGFSPQLSLSSHDLMLDRSPAPTPQSPSTRNAEVAGRILLVEDNPVNQEVACGMLELLGYQTRVVENGRHAVAAAAEGEMDVILMDCQMPEMDGFTATDEIRRQAAAAGRRRIPIIALTAHAMQGDRDQCLAAGMDDYLTKPFTERQLREVLSKWVRRAASAEPPGTPVSVAQLQGVAGQPTTSHEEISPALDLKALDSIRALQRPNRPNVLASVLRKYLDNSRESVEALRAAIRSGDPAAVQAIAHRLKSSSAQLGALAVAARCKELEQIGIRKDLVDADRVFEQLQSEYVTVCTTFRNEIAKGDPS
ncbi:MAG: ATP-binding protein [Nitrospira sp.]|nr:ATP-binding protein [Nitrospira sp.]